MELRQSLAWCKEVKLFSAGSSVSNHAPFAFAHHFVALSVHETDWVKSLQEIVTDQGITHIFPAHDDALLALAESAEHFTAKIVTSPLDTCRIARSKTATLRHLEGTVPTTKLFANRDEVEGFPVFIKPDRGQGSYRTACAHCRQELLALLYQDTDRIILEYLPGPEFTVDCFSDRKLGLLYASGRERSRIKAGIAMASKRTDDSRFAQYAQRINSRLEMHGAWFFQLKADDDGVLKLMEVAPRIGGTSALSRARGVNLPLLSLYEAERIPVRLMPGTYDVQIDRALINRYRHNIDCRVLYVDFDDTLVIRGHVNTDLVKLLYQALNRGIRLILLTRYAGDLQTELRRYRLHELFDTLVHLRNGESKADFIRKEQAILIDDSWAERMAVHERTGIPVFDTSMIDVLLDDRV